MINSNRRASSFKFFSINLFTLVCLVPVSHAQSVAVTAQGTGSSVADQRQAIDVLAIRQGQLRGLVDSANGDTESFKGIPFAAPPVGDLRWRPPQPPAAWDGVRDCFTFGPSCAQGSNPIMNLLPIGSVGQTDEDCLYLNIYRPTNPTEEKLPVLVWIHGGGYDSGSGSQGLYDGAGLARRGAIVVTINYRLGLFGFMAHPALSQESKQGVSGNYGILDQIQALRWVKENIAAFGGDPNRVTIFGESAGGGSVICLLVSPDAEGLFQRAIAQSAPVMNLRHLRRDHRFGMSAEQFGQRMMVECGLDERASVEDMRSLSTEQLIAVSGNRFAATGQPNRLLHKALMLPIAPIVDGKVIPEDPNVAMAAGRFHQVPLIVGNTRDEAELFMFAAPVALSDHEQYEQQAAVEFGDLAPEILKAYPLSQNRSQMRASTVHLLTDLIFGAQSRKVAKASSVHVPATYKYLFSREIRALVISAAFHGCEIPYLFGTPAVLATDKDRQIAGHMADYWVNFAATGDPNGTGLPHWPQYDPDQPGTLELGDEVRVLAGYRGQPLDVIDQFLTDRP